MELKRDIEVPIHWAGTSRHGRWTCGACATPEACAEAGRCDRASDEDFERGQRLMNFGRRN